MKVQGCGVKGVGISLFGLPCPFCRFQAVEMRRLHGSLAALCGYVQKRHRGEPSFYLSQNKYVSDERCML